MSIFSLHYGIVASSHIRKQFYILNILSIIWKTFYRKEPKEIILKNYHQIIQLNRDQSDRGSFILNKITDCLLFHRPKPFVNQKLTFKSNFLLFSFLCVRWGFLHFSHEPIGTLNKNTKSTANQMNNQGNLKKCKKFESDHMRLCPFGNSSWNSACSRYLVFHRCTAWLPGNIFYNFWKFHAGLQDFSF